MKAAALVVEAHGPAAQAVAAAAHALALRLLAASPAPAAGEVEAAVLTACGGAVFRCELRSMLSGGLVLRLHGRSPGPGQHGWLPPLAVTGGRPLPPYPPPPEYPYRLPFNACLHPRPFWVR